MNYGTNPTYQSILDKTGKYNPLPKEFREISRKLSGNALKVWIELIHCHRFPSQRELAARLGLDLRTITKAIRELYELSLLIIQGKDRSVSKYNFNPNRSDWGKKPTQTAAVKVCTNIPTKCREKLPQKEEIILQKIPTEHSPLLIVKKEDKHKKVLEDLAFSWGIKAGDCRKARFFLDTGGH